jgi:sec-independent protein translocase protein TatB
VFGISMWEIVVILVIGLIILGPRQLAEVARTAGKLYREIQKMTWDLKNSIDLDEITSPSKKSDHVSYSDNTPEATETIETKETTESEPQEFDFMPGEKSGPDFYADLIETSRKEEEAPEDYETTSADSEHEDHAPKQNESKEGKES